MDWRLFAYADNERQCLPFTDKQQTNTIVYIEDIVMLPEV
jgi:hypothetical protein